MAVRSALIVFVLAAVAAVQVLPPIDQAAGAETWRAYHNERYGTTIEYPDFFKPARPPDNGDGQEFKSADGADFAVLASYNALDFDLAKFQQFTMENLETGRVVTYRARGDDWFVISGTKGAGVFYERHLLSHGAQMTEGFVMSYPARLKQTYDPIVARMSKSFRSGTGFQAPDKP